MRKEALAGAADTTSALFRLGRRFSPLGFPFLAPHSRCGLESRSTALGFESNHRDSCLRDTIPGSYPLRGGRTELHFELQELSPRIPESNRLTLSLCSHKYSTLATLCQVPLEGIEPSYNSLEDCRVSTTLQRQEVHLLDRSEKIV